MGDPARMQVLKAVIDETRKENLLYLVNEAGKVLLSGLKELEVSMINVIGTVGP